MPLSTISPITFEGQPQELSSFLRAGVMYVLWHSPVTDTGQKRLHWKPHTGADFTEITPDLVAVFKNVTTLYHPASDQLVVVWEDGTAVAGSVNGNILSARFNALTGALVSGPTTLFPGSQAKLSYRTVAGDQFALYYLTAKTGGVYGRLSLDGGVTWQSGEPLITGQVVGTQQLEVVPYDEGHVSIAQLGSDPRALAEIGMLQRTRPISSIVKHPTVAGQFFVGEPSKFDNTTLIDNLRGGLVLATDNTQLFHLDGVQQGVDDTVGAVALLVATGTKLTAGHQGHVLDSRAIALWRFDETSGNLIDSLGARTMSLSSGTYPSAVGQINGARTPGTTTSEFTAPTVGSDFPGVAGDISVEFWGYLQSGPPGYIFSLAFAGIEHTSGGGSAQNKQFGIDVHTSGSLRMTWEHGSSRIIEAPEVTSSFSLDAWHHFGSVRYLSGGSAFVEFYFDGVLAATLGPFTPPDGGSSCLWVVGANYATLAGGFTTPGFRQDDTRISFVRRTANEILESYSRGVAPGAYAGPTGNGDDMTSYTLVPTPGTFGVDLPGTSVAVSLGVSSTYGYVAEYADNSGVLGQLIVVDLSSGSTGTVFTGVTGVRAVGVANFLVTPLIFVASTESGFERLRVYSQLALTPTLLLNTKLPARANSITVTTHPTNPTSVRVLVSMVDRFNIYDYSSAASPVLLVDSYKFSGGGTFFKSVVATNGNIVVAAGNAGVLVLNSTGKVKAQIPVSGKVVPPWTPSTSYTIGQFFKPRPTSAFARNRTYFRVTTTGTSGSSEPQWAATGTVSDSGAQWTAQGSTDGVATDVALDETLKRIYAVGVAGGDLGTDGRVWILGAGGLL